MRRTMSKHRKGISSFWISTIIALLLSIFLTMASYLGGIYFGAFNKTLILDSLNKTSYYHAIMDNTLDKAQSLAIPMGLQPEVFDNVFTLDETYAEGNALIRANLDEQDYIPKTSNAVDRLVSNINIYLTQNNLTVTSEQQENIVTFANVVSDEYAKNLSVPYIKYYTSLRNISLKLIYFGVPLLLMLSAFAVFLLMKTQKWIHRSLRFIAYSTLSASLMTAGFPIFLLVTGPYKHLNVTPEYFYNFIVHYITESLFTFVYISLLLFVISIAVITVIRFKKRELIKSRK